MYYVPKNTKNFVKTEIFEMKKNKKDLENIDIKGKRSRTLIKIEERILAIEKTFRELNPEDRKIAEMIFFEKLSRGKLEAMGIGRRTYYNIMDKVIYLAAINMNEL